LGRALIRNPAVLLLDEPLTHRDARLRHEMRVELKLLQRWMSTTTIHVTHDQLEAWRWAT
jgi:multiple sugar transport system ATP-binding protein